MAVIHLLNFECSKDQRECKLALSRPNSPEM